eukprot:Sspe_Gene.5531::Locus_1827_Transcript_1_1_Confidence_1.000_Length_1697::g.5531::m.5531/K01610/E4.1.1.49, pckA; phosphoenolpyruvate carboxykinase (ATP)
MTNMLVRPTAEELETFGEPDFTIYNAGCFPCNRNVKGMSSSTSIALHFGRNEMVILGSQYAGEMKKGVLTVMMYLMPKRGMLTLHSSCNEGKDGKSTLFFGLSGTGKTTLSADPKRYLIGDDEHVWHDDGVFNIEGGCYAKCIGLREEAEPEIFRAVRFGALVENVVMDPQTRVILRRHEHHGEHAVLVPAGVHPEREAAGGDGAPGQRGAADVRTRGGCSPP